jgi:hypothetical protein
MGLFYTSPLGCFVTWTLTSSAQSLTLLHVSAETPNRGSSDVLGPILQLCSRMRIYLWSRWHAGTAVRLQTPRPFFLIKMKVGVRGHPELPNMTIRGLISNHQCEWRVALYLEILEYIPLLFSQVSCLLIRVKVSRGNNWLEKVHKSVNQSKSARKKCMYKLSSLAEPFGSGMIVMSFAVYLSFEIQR